MKVLAAQAPIKMHKEQNRQCSIIVTAAIFRWGKTLVRAKWGLG